MPKVQLFSKMDICHDYLLIKPYESTGRGSKPCISYFFLGFIPKLVLKLNFFKHQNRLRPMSILSHSLAAD